LWFPQKNHLNAQYKWTLIESGVNKSVILSKIPGPMKLMDVNNVLTYEDRDRNYTEYHSDSNRTSCHTSDNVCRDLEN
jgi:hypothetical protein